MKLYDKKIKEKNTLEMREKTKVSTSSLAGGKMAHLDRRILKNGRKGVSAVSGVVTCVCMVQVVRNNQII